MAAVRKVRGRRWEDRETKLLLEKWGDENIQTALTQSVCGASMSASAFWRLFPV